MSEVRTEDGVRGTQTGARGRQSEDEVWVHRGRQSEGTGHGYPVPGYTPSRHARVHPYTTAHSCWLPVPGSAPVANMLSRHETSVLALGPPVLVLGPPVIIGTRTRPVYDSSRPTRVTANQG